MITSLHYFLSLQAWSLPSKWCGSPWVSSKCLRRLLSPLFHSRLCNLWSLKTVARLNLFRAVALSLLKVGQRTQAGCFWLSAWSNHAQSSSFCRTSSQYRVPSHISPTTLSVLSSLTRSAPHSPALTSTHQFQLVQLYSSWPQHSAHLS